MGIKYVNVTAHNENRLLKRLVYKNDEVQFIITISNYSDYYGRVKVKAFDNLNNIWLDSVIIGLEAKGVANIATVPRKVDQSFTLTAQLLDIVNNTKIDESMISVRVLPLARSR